MAQKRSLGHTRILGKKELFAAMPSLKKKGLKGGVAYSDGQFDDARLAIALARTADDLGGTLLNYVNVTGLVKENGKLVGLQAQDVLNGKEYAISTKVVINATGVFVDNILDMDDPDAPAAVMPSQGIHLVVSKDFFPGDVALMIPKTEDGRVLFALPWQDALVIGTTDTPLDEISDEPMALETEIDFIINHFNAYNTINITRKDIMSVFAGLRPLVKTLNKGSTALASRDHTILVSSSNLITITGGKWTTYRKMAKDAVNNAAFVAKFPIVKCATRKLRLHGYDDHTLYGSEFSAYGSDAVFIRQMISDDSSMGERIHPLHNYCKAELVWAVSNEMAMTVEDILARRSRMLFVDARAAIASAEPVATLMAEQLGMDAAWKEDQVSRFQEMAEQYLG
jgi:glycerol-3-phosphate dehydrogenase